MKFGGKRGQATWYEGLWSDSFDKRTFLWEQDIGRHPGFPAFSEISKAITSIGSPTFKTSFTSLDDSLYGRDGVPIYGSVLLPAIAEAEVSSADEVRPSVTVMGSSRSPGGAPVRPFSQVFVSDGYEAQNHSNLHLTIFAQSGANIDIGNPPAGVTAHSTTVGGAPRYHLSGSETALNAYLDTLVLPAGKHDESNLSLPIRDIRCESNSSPRHGP